MTKVNKWDDLLQEFIGKDKVESVSIKRGNKGNGWIYRYKERINGKMKPFSMAFPDRKTADEFHFQFGGKNPTSVSAPNEFIKLGDWDSGDIRSNGHRITEISLAGMRTVRDSVIPIDMPKGTGHDFLMGKKKKKKGDLVKFNLTDNEKCNVTRVFESHDEFDQFTNFLCENDMLKELTFHVRKLMLENEETKDVGFWKRCRAKDGTDRMILELKEINEKKYSEFMFFEILSYADGMADGECCKISKGKPKVTEEVVCYFAAKEGKFKDK